MKNKLFSKIIAIILCLSVVFANMIFTVSAAETSDPIIVVSGSDFQTDSSNVESTNVPYDVPDKIFQTVKNAYSDIDGYLFAGDYTAKQDDADGTKRGLQVFKDLLEDYYPNLEADDQVWIQGNHDPTSTVTDGTLAQSGNNDREDYGVFVINEDDYPAWGENSIVSTTANNLREYLNEKVQAEYTKPIFIVSHVSLHYSYRTAKETCSIYGSTLLDLLNDASEAGLNIIYMYGHTHNNGYDDYIGGDEVFFKKGDVINVATSRYTWEEREIEFTYLNAGYTAVYWAGYGSTSKWNTSMVVYEITEDTVTFNRYGENGLLKLKDKGQTANASEEYDPYEPAINNVVYESGYVLNLSKEVNTDVIVGEDLRMRVDFLVNDKLGYSFYAYGNDLSLYSSYDIVVEYGCYGMGNDGTAYTETKKTVTYSSNDSSSKVFTYKEVAAYEMMLGTTFTLKCYDEDGNVARQKSATITYASLVAQTMFKAKNNQTVYIDMLNYGSAVQTYFAAKNPGTDLADNTTANGLPTDIVGVSAYQQYATSDEVASADTASKEANSSTSNGARIGATMQILSSNRLVFVVDAGEYDVANLKLVVGEKEIAVSDLELNGSYYYYYPSEDDAIALYDIDKVISAELYNGEELVATKTYSIEAFVASNMKDGAETEALADALMKFSHSLVAHIENQPRLEAATEIVSGNYYVIVNATTGTVMTQEFSASSLLLGSLPSASESDAWQITLDTSNNKYVLPMTYGGETVYVQTNNGSMGCPTEFEGKIVFDYDEETGLWLISRQQDGSSSIYYFTLNADMTAVTGSANNVIDDNSYWYIYEVKNRSFEEENPDDSGDDEEDDTIPGLREVTSIETGKDYIIVNQRTGTVLTNDVETGAHWYADLGEQSHFLLGSTPTTESDTWSFTTYNDGYAIAAGDGSGYMSPNTVNAHKATSYTDTTPIYITYNESKGGFELYRNTSDGTKCQLVGCKDLDGSVLYAIGCNSDAFEIFAYWTIYEIVDESTEPVEPTTDLQAVTAIETGKDYVVVNKATGTVLTNSLENGNYWYLENENYVLLAGEPSTDSNTWSFSTYDGGYAMAAGNDTGYLSPNTVNASIIENYTWGTPIHVVYNETEAAFQIYRLDGESTYKLVSCQDTEGSRICAIGCYTTDFDAYSYWEIYEIVENTTDPDQPGTDEPTDPEEPTSSLQAVSAIETGKDYVIVNKKTGTVLTNTIESGAHWYNGLSGNHVLLGSEPTVDSDTWSFVTYNDGYAIAFPAEIGGYLSPNTVNVHNSGMYEWTTPVYAVYSETEGAFQFYRTESGGTDCKLVACNSLKEDGTSTGEYVYAIGCNSGDFASYSYWIVYEIVENTTNPDQPGTDEPTDPEDPDEPVDPDTPVDPEDPTDPEDPEDPTNPEQPTVPEGLKLATTIESGKSYVFVNNTTGTVMNKQVSGGAIVLGGTASADSDSWLVEIDENNNKYVLPYAIDSETTGWVQVNNGNASVATERAGKIVFTYDSENARWTITRQQDGSSSIYYFTLNTDQTGVIGSKEDITYWTIYEVEGSGTTDPEDPGTDEPTDPEDPEDPEEPTDPETPVVDPTVPIEGLTVATTIESGKSYVFVNNTTGTVMNKQVSGGAIVLGGTASADSDSWLVEIDENNNKYVLPYAIDSETTGWVQVNNGNASVATEREGKIVFTYDSENARWTITRQQDNSSSIYYFTLNSAQTGVIGSKEDITYWTIYEVNGSGTTDPEDPGTDEPTDPEDPEDPEEPTDPETPDDDVTTDLKVTIPDGWVTVSKLQDATDYIIVNKATGYAWSSTYSGGTFSLTDSNSSYWQFTDGGAGLSYVKSDGSTAGYYQPNGNGSDKTPITAATSMNLTSLYRSAKSAWTIGRYSSSGTYYFIADAESNKVTSTAKLGESDTIPDECYWIIYGRESDIATDDGSDDKYDDPDTGANFTFAFSTDVHVGNGSDAIANVRTMYKDFDKLLDEGVELDTILISGDLTQDSYEGEWDLMLNAVTTFSPAGIRTYSTLGNHDVRSYDYSDGGRPKDERWAEIWPRYQAFMTETSGLSLTVPYYHVEIEGHNGTTYDLVVLCTETAEKDNINMSSTQLAWFEAKLEEIEAKRGADQNIIVMCHQNVPGTVSSSDYYDQYEEEVENIIAEHPQVIYISGHIHTSYKKGKIVDEGKGIYVDGIALYEEPYYRVIEIYDDYIQFRIRGIDGTWLDDYTKTISLK